MDKPISRRTAALVTMFANYMGLAFNVVVNIVLVPIYLRFLSTESYGAWLASGGIVAMLGIVDGGLGLILTQRMSSKVGAQRQQELAVVAGSGWMLTAVGMVIILCVGVTCAPWVPPLINARPADYAALRLAFTLASAGAALSVAQANFLAYAYAWQRTQVVSWVTFLSLSAGVITTLAGLGAGVGVVAFGAAALARGAVGCLTACLHVVADWRRRSLPKPWCSTGEAREQLASVGPMFVLRTGSVILANSESALASVWLGPSAAVVLALTTKIFQVAQSLLNPIAGSSGAGLSHLAASAGRARLLSVLRELFEISATFSACAFGGALAINKAFIYQWVGPQAYGGLLLALASCCANLCIVRVNLLTVVLPSLGVIRRVAWAGLVEPVMRVGLLCLFLPHWGVIGVPLATLLGACSLGGAVLPVFLAKRLQISWAESMRLVGRGTGPIAVCLGLGLFAAYVTEWQIAVPGGWRMLAAYGVCVGALLLLAILALSPMARALTKRAFRLPRFDAQ